MRAGSTQRAVSGGLAALVLMLATANAAEAQSPDQLGCGLEPGPSRAVARVIDAATVVLDDRSEVRLQGLVVPSSADAGAVSGSWPPEAAARAALERLVGGRTVALAFAGPRTDRWGRILAHLFVDDGSAQSWVQGRLVEAGHARVFAPPGGEACVEALIEREAAARQADRGLWANAAYHVRPADRPSELARYVGTFQLVRGRIEQAVGSRTPILRFASAEVPSIAGRERGFRAVIRQPGAIAAFGAPRALVGRDVLVRGWVEARSGPEIEVVSSGQVVVEGSAVPRARRRSGAAPAKDGRPAEPPPGAQK